LTAAASVSAMTDAMTIWRSMIASCVRRPETDYCARQRKTM
jgi:hypothetical protein